VRDAEGGEAGTASPSVESVIARSEATKQSLIGGCSSFEIASVRSQ